MKNKNTSENGTRRTGGLYSRVNMSVKSANIMVASLIALLITASVFIISHNGFTVQFDTDGGSYIAPLRAMHSDTIDVSPPVKEGWQFTGWYTDRGKTQKWNAESDIVEGSMTLYAAWEKVEQP